jgi:hypothetical protein
MSLLSSDHVTDYRVTPDVLESPLLISCLPANLNAAALLFADRWDKSTNVQTVSFLGPGLEYYRSDIGIELLAAGT